MVWRCCISLWTKLSLAIRLLVHVGLIGVSIVVITAIRSTRVGVMIISLSVTICIVRHWRGRVVPHGIDWVLHMTMRIIIRLVCSAIGWCARRHRLGWGWWVRDRVIGWTRLPILVVCMIHRLKSKTHQLESHV